MQRPKGRGVLGSSEKPRKADFGDQIRTVPVALHAMLSFICSVLENLMENFRQAKCPIMHNRKLQPSDKSQGLIHQPCDRLNYLIYALT